MDKGILYGVSVGPGDPSLMTLKAVDVINSCNIIAAPRTNNKKMVALEIVEKTLDLSKKIIISLDFAMSHDKEKRESSHNIVAGLIQAHLDKGESVALLNLGDISIYSTFNYVAEILSNKDYEIEMIPGVTSFCAAASALKISLTNIHSPIHILPTHSKSDCLECKRDGTTIWMKSGSALENLLDGLKKENKNFYLVQNLGLEDEKIYDSVENINIKNDYFSIIIEKE